MYNVLEDEMLLLYVFWMYLQCEECVFSLIIELTGVWEMITIIVVFYVFVGMDVR